MAITQEQVERFAALFQGYSQAHGTFTVGRANERGKVQGRAKTVRGGATLEHYRTHLEGGEEGLGIIMLRDDETVLFGAIDYDHTNMDHVKAERRIAELGLPLVLCRSKSGGGHFYVFLSEPVDANLLRARLDEWKALMGMASKTEVFPKQSQRLNADDIGSFINLPYYHAERTVRYATIAGKSATLDEFLEYAESKRVSPADLHKASAGAGTLFKDGPPCLRVIEHQGGFHEGCRNQGMAATLVYLRRAYPDSWKGMVDEYNKELVHPPLPSDEVQSLVKSYARKEYTYSCKQSPLAEHCNRRECLQSKFGIGDSRVVDAENQQVEINNITKYVTGNNDPPMWAMEIGGRRVMVTHDEFFSKDIFNKVCFARIGWAPVNMTQARWIQKLNELHQRADIVEMPEEASPTGQLWEWIQTFCLQNINAVTRDEIVLGKPYREEGKIYFRGHDLFNFLDSRKVKYKSEQQVWHLLREKGAENTSFTLRGGKFVRVWSMPAPEPVVDPDTPPPPKPQEHF